MPVLNIPLVSSGRGNYTILSLSCSCSRNRGEYVGAPVNFGWCLCQCWTYLWSRRGEVITTFVHYLVVVQEKGETMLVHLLTLVSVCASLEHPFGLVGERSSLPKSKLHTKHHNKQFFSLQTQWRSWRIITNTSNAQVKLFVGRMWPWCCCNYRCRWPHHPSSNITTIAKIHHKHPHHNDHHCSPKWRSPPSYLVPRLASLLCSLGNCRFSKSLTCLPMCAISQASFPLKSKPREWRGSTLEDFWRSLVSQ